MAKDIQISPILGDLVGGAGMVIVVAGLKLAAPIVNLVLISSLLAFSISPIQNWLIRRKFPKGLAVAVTVLLILVGGSVLIFILATSLSGLIEKLPAYQARLTSLWNAVTAFFIKRGIDLTSLLSLKGFGPDRMVAVAGKVLEAVLQALSNSVFVAIIMVFVLIELASLQYDVLGSKSERIGLHKRVNQVVEDVGKYIAITSWIGLINAVANFLWLLVLGIDSALTWAVLSFFFCFIPNIGIVMAILLPALIALLEFGWVRALLVVAGYEVLHFISENVIKPRTMKAQLDLSPLLTILSVIFWSWVLGLPGAILAVPLTITLQKLVKEQVGRGHSA
jgi:AI-2 transport protein TqsA